MSNYENLKSIGDRTTEEQREITSKGGKASGEARRKKKDMKDLARALLECSVPDKEKEAIKKLFPEIDLEDLNHATSLILAQVKKARNGNTEAFKAVRDTAGYNPVIKNADTDTEGNDKPIIVASEKDKEAISKLDSAFEDD